MGVALQGMAEVYNVYTEETNDPADALPDAVGAAASGTSRRGSGENRRMGVALQGEDAAEMARKILEVQEDRIAIEQRLKDADKAAVEEHDVVQEDRIAIEQRLKAADMARKILEVQEDRIAIEQ